MQRRKFLSLSTLIAFAAMTPVQLSAENYRATKPDVWTSHTVDDSIKKLYGTRTTIQEGVKLTAPDVASNGGAIPVDIKSDISAKSVALFQDANPEAAVIVYTVHEGGIIDYSLKMKMKASGTITVVVEGRDGKLYSANKTLDVALGGCEG